MRDTDPAAFDRRYWDARWGAAHPTGDAMCTAPPNPHLVEAIGRRPGATALDAGCGAGNEALWLAAHGWQVTAVDISGTALQAAVRRAQGDPAADRIDWIRADLTAWEPESPFDLVTTHYAHSSMPQLDFYERLAGWVKPGGTLFIVGHLEAPHAHGHAGNPPHETTVTAGSITARLDATNWRIVAAREVVRAAGPSAGREPGELRDVVVQAVRIR